jgi:hypothetical protein
MSADVVLISDGPGYYIMSGATEAGKAFVRERTLSPSIRGEGNVSIDCTSYPGILADAAAAGLVILEQ